MITSYEAASGIDVLTSTFPVPGFGVVPINAFVLHGPEPVLVDTGPIVEREEFMAALGSVIDPADLRWIWLTHTDFDHIGALPQLLAENPQLRANHPRFGLDNRIYIANGLLGGTIEKVRHTGRETISISGRDFRFDPREGA